jgi:hypothetical protein
MEATHDLFRLLIGQRLWGLAGIAGFRQRSSWLVLFVHRLLAVGTHPLFSDREETALPFAFRFARLKEHISYITWPAGFQACRARVETTER